MKSRILSISAVLLLVRTCVLGGGPADDLRRMTGTWSAVIIETGGKEATPAERNRLRMRLVVRGDGGYSMFFGDEQVATGMVRLNPSTKPASMDVIPSDGPFKGRVQAGVYAFQGEDMWTVFAEPGQARPGGFKTRPGTMESMVFYRRVK